MPIGKHPQMEASVVGFPIWFTELLESWPLLEAAPYAEIRGQAVASDWVQKGKAFYFNHIPEQYGNLSTNAMQVGLRNNITQMMKRAGIKPDEFKVTMLPTKGEDHRKIDTERICYVIKLAGSQGARVLAPPTAIPTPPYYRNVETSAI